MTNDPAWKAIRESIDEARVLIACALAKPIPSDVATVTRRDRWAMAFAETHLVNIVAALENAIELHEALRRGALDHECTSGVCDKCRAVLAANRLSRSFAVYVPAEEAERCADKLELLRLRTHGVLTAQLQDRIARMGRELDQCYATIGKMEESSNGACASVRRRLGRDNNASGHDGDPELL